METINGVHDHLICAKFQSPCGEMIDGNDVPTSVTGAVTDMFQSPCGEMIDGNFVLRLSQIRKAKYQCFNPLAGK